MINDHSRIFKVAVLMMIFTALLSVCEIKISRAATETTQTTTTTTEVGRGNSSSTVTNDKTVVAVEPEKKEGHSIIGSFFGFVGNVIAFPFRLIGSAFAAIF